MNIQKILEIISEITFADGKIVFVENSTVMKIYYQLLTHTWMLKNSIVLTTPERFSYCENEPCFDLVCFQLINLFKQQSLPPEVCGCPFKHDKEDVDACVGEIKQFLNSSKQIQKRVQSIIRQIAAMDLGNEETTFKRTVFEISTGKKYPTALPHFDSERLFTQQAKRSEEKPKPVSKAQLSLGRGARAGQPLVSSGSSGSAPPAYSNARKAPNWHRVVSNIDSHSIPDKKTASDAAAESLAHVQRLKQMIEEEKARLMDVDEIRSALQAKKQADQQAEELQRELDSIRRQFQVSQDPKRNQKAFKNTPAVVTDAKVAKAQDESDDEAVQADSQTPVIKSATASETSGNGDKKEKS